MLAGLSDYVAQFLVNLIFFGLISSIAGSAFPTHLGLFLFFTNDAFIAWVLGTIGIRIVPDTPGAYFVSAFVWMIGAGMLFGYWRNAAPDWLASFIALSWSEAALAAAGCAVFATGATAIVERLLPQWGIALPLGSWRRLIAWHAIFVGLVGLCAGALAIGHRHGAY